VAVAAAAANGDDARAAESALADLDRDEAHKSLTADTVQKARAALERARRLRAGGDEARAKLADGLAREWAEMARDLVKAADAEQTAAQARRNALDAGAHSERERALLEEGLARTGRLRAQLDDAEREAKETNRTATAALDGGVMPKKPKPPRGAQGGPGSGPSPAPAPAPKNSAGGAP
jgi:ATP/maltotriose-dependent transcriptional regulator MalT